MSLISLSKNRPNNLNTKHNHSQFVELRKNYPVFEYQSYTYIVNDGGLEAKFIFKLGKNITFTPSIKIPDRSFYNFEILSDSDIKNLVFHIGMIELISYWKAACPPRLVIHPHKLNNKQVSFWKKLYFNGLGEFFYLNGIEVNEQDFMQIVSRGDKLEPFLLSPDMDAVIVPVGGGKDSVVTLELLKESGNKIIPMAMNPREAVVRSIENAGFTMEDSIVVNRILDIKLLELNKQGFLNGHTPFSALLAFVTTLSAAIAGVKHIALSNESSANESTVPDSNVNHQYSKSFEFEQDFNRYSSEFITPDVHYFSFLRPLNELQIGALFSLLKQHHFSFRSCNVGSKTDSWCGHCPKCLFVRTILGPFMETRKLEKVFDKELFDDITLKPIFDELTGVADVKPFECVGTPDEVNASVGFIVEHWNGVLPVLLQTYFVEKKGNNNLLVLLSEFNNDHFVPKKYLSVLKNSLKKISLEA